MVTTPVAEMDLADVGAGTGIFPWLLEERRPRLIAAIEPNDEMGSYSVRDSKGTGIRWAEGSGEDTGLAAGSVGLLTAACCFHWMDFDLSTREFHRVLRPSGRFVAMWNPT
jgi:ubiquinone/menaquinone biosynthesis C-methylase UbiE